MRSPGLSRIDAIDRLRALTMVLMIFVNDLWTLKGIPGWLGHVEWGVDGMGLADVVFPAFLFIVGLSLPFAIDARRNKGEGTVALIGHVISRAIALIIMGVFLVNGETINGDATGISRTLWFPLSCAAFILIWNSWTKGTPQALRVGLQIVGGLGLIAMAFVYRGGEAGVERFGPQWWGILGLIGWAYLVAGLVAVLAKGKLWALIAAWAAFAGLSVLWAAKLVPTSLHLIPEPIIGGTMTALVLGGAVIGRLFQTLRDHTGRMMAVFAAITAGLVVLYFLTRPEWGLSKLAATPAWLFITSAITLAGFALLALLGGKGEAVFRPIKQAGTDTLLCYLIPYFAYAAMTLVGLSLPEALTTGGVGLVKSLLFALICVWIAGAASKWLGVRLKL